MKFQRLSLVTLAALSMASLSACDADSGSNPGGSDIIGDNPTDVGTDQGTDGGGETPPVARARLRAIHLSPDAPAVDIFANGGPTAAVTGLAFPNGTDYLDLEAGTYDFDIAPAGAGIGAKVKSVPDLLLEGGKSYTAFAYDGVASLKVGALVDDDAGLAPGNIRVRAIHVAVGVGQVDIWNIPASGSPAPLYPDFDFGAVGDYLDLPAGAYTLGFDIDNDATPDLVFETPTLPAGAVINLFAVAQGTDVFLIAQLNDGSTARIDPRPAPVAKARIRAIHLSPDAPAVDIFANDAGPAVVTNLAFPQGTGYLELDPGSYNFDLAPAGAGLASSVLDTGRIDLAGGQSYTAFAYDGVASLKVGALVDDDAGLAPGNIRVRAIHVAVGVGQVDIWNIPASGSPAPLYPDFDFGAVGDYLDLPAGAYTLGFDIDNDATPDLVFETPTLPAGAVINLFAIAQGTDVFLIAQLNDGSTARIDPVSMLP